jgi:hypothetical protein
MYPHPHPSLHKTEARQQAMHIAGLPEAHTALPGRLSRGNKSVLGAKFRIVIDNFTASSSMGAMKTYQEHQPWQGFLLPPSPLDLLLADQLAYSILETVAQLDLSRVTAYYARERRCLPSHDPRMMTALLLYV